MKLYKFMLLVLIFLTTANSAEVSGQAFLKTNDGRVITCAGETVYLDVNSTSSLTDYSLSLAISGYIKSSQRLAKAERKYKEVMRLEKEIQADKKKLAIQKGLIEEFVNENKILTSICDAQGNFIFKNVPKGDFTMATTVEWKAGNETQGGFLTKVVNIEEENVKIKVVIVK